MRGTPAAHAAVAPTSVGNGFVVTPGDLTFILKQIKISERHAAAFKGDLNAAPANPDVAGDPSYCQALLGPAVDQVPDPLTSYGLRTVDGSCNNLVKNSAALSGRDRFGAADQIFPRLTSQNYRDAETAPAGAFGPGSPATPTSYANHVPGNVVWDTQPRVISNLIVDQTSTNPAAVDVAANPVRTQANPDRVIACAPGGDPSPANPDGTPAGCVPSHKTLFIPNITTDVGLSPPFNSWFTFFGQFFDHGVDQTVKSDGTVFVPLRPDDPLLQPGGADGNPATPGDQADPHAAFIPITRATVRRGPGPDGVLGNGDDTYDAFNTDTPWVDQSQTYTSHAAHQVYLREYNQVGGKPVDTGKFLDGLPAGQTYVGSPDGAGGMATWAAIKQQALAKLGLQLVDTDVTNIPAIAADPYGNFIPDPATGMPQFLCSGPCINPDTNAVEGSGNMVSGDIASPVKAPKNVRHFDTPFLTDIAHNADPSPIDTNHDGIPDTFPTPDVDDTPSTDFAHQPAGTYDDEMLNAHFVCGDGRCNENIALSAVHSIFHMEHNRLVDDIDATLHKPGNEALLADFQAQHLLAPGDDVSFGYGGRLFQAARFVTEMEYQHLVFEEFARKVVPAVHPFHVYATDVNPAIDAEFAHAVYRFGHSMLDDTVARTSTVPDPTAPSGTKKVDNSLALLTAFLNPPSFFDNTKGAAAATGVSKDYTAAQAVGAIVMGSVDQSGNEIDEFVTETLRNNLLGLPLDLPAINMARARSEGIPPLNDVRRQINAQTHDAALAPYTNWSDFGQHLKHPQSLVNFVAAYGTHPTIRDSGPDGIRGNTDDVTTVAAKRAAARAIVDPNPTLGDNPPCDAAAFMFGLNGNDPVSCPDGVDWSSDSAGRTTTGVDGIDLWVGGLAEVTNLFGGMLGSTFNYVFQTQLEKLQDNDRLYYLARTPGLNLRTQLEGNSFAEMIQRNTTTDTNSLKADVFATADCKFQIGNLHTPAPAGSAITGVGSVADDPASACNENALLLAQPNPDGSTTWQYRARNSVNPPGINGQSVYNGTDLADHIYGGNDNDTFWGHLGDDRIEANGGDDVAFGGFGNDVITDLDGADVLEGGPGNDAIDAGPGDDLTIGNEGQDFITNGLNDNETFAGEGTDFIEAGAGADAVFGDGGDDWIEGGTGQDLLQGDHGAPFFDDPGEVKPGNDIFIGQPGENDYDAEGGDDIMEQNPAIDRNAGAAGFDWAIHQSDTAAADDDMMINQQLFGVPLQLVVNRDRWQETEADTGSDNFADVIRGDNLERIVGPAGFSGCDALDPTGVGRIAGLDKYGLFANPSQLFNTGDVIDASAMKRCPLNGFGGTAADPRSGVVWAQGNILMGGGKSDILEGRGNDDVIDGDHSLNVYISVRQGVDADGLPTGPEIARTDLMEHSAISGSFFPGATPAMTLEQAVFSKLVNPGQLVPVREIHDPSGKAVGANIDPATTAATGTPDTATAGDCPATIADTAPPTSVTLGVAGTTNCDISFYEAPFATCTAGACTPTGNYDVVRNADGSVTVTDTAEAAARAAVIAAPPFTAADVLFAGKGDGIDTLWNIEALRFCTGNDAVTKKCNATQTFTIQQALDLLQPPAPAAPAIALSTATLGLGSLATGTTTTSSVTLSNTGAGPLTVSGITITGADAGSFSQTTTCTTVAPGGFCTVAVTFAPTTAGAKAATLNIASNAPNSPATVALTGTGTAPVVAVSPASLSFGNQLTGTTSAAQAITVTNTGDANLAVSGVTLTGADAGSFSQTTTCTAAVAPGSTCTVSVTFAPTTAGAKTASVSIASNALNAPTTVALSGTGVAPAPVIGVSPASLGFGNQTTNTTSAAKTITVSNTGTASLAAPTVTKTGTNAALFTVTGCTAAVPAGGSCTISVTFRPTTTGAKSASVSIAHTAGNVASPILVGLSGTGVPPASTATIASIAFGAKAAGSATAKDALVTNTGTAPLIITAASIAPTTGFTVAMGTCTAAVAPGRTCKLSVTFRPVAATASYSSKLTLTSNASNSPSATLTGTRR